MKEVSVPFAQQSPCRNIRGKLYGKSHKAIVLSNMDTNDQAEWDPLVNGLVTDGYMILTYAYPRHADDQSGTLEAVVSFIREAGAERVILVGASRGGVASIKVAARNTYNEFIAGVVALSAPIEHEGVIFYCDQELCGIEIPKLLINSENDDGARDNRKMFELFKDSKEFLIYPGSAHGTELFYEQEKSIIHKIRNFAASVFSYGSWSPNKG